MRRFSKKVLLLRRILIDGVTLISRTSSSNSCVFKAIFFLTKLGNKGILDFFFYDKELPLVKLEYS